MKQILVVEGKFKYDPHERWVYIENNEALPFLDSDLDALADGISRAISKYATLDEQSKGIQIKIAVEADVSEPDRMVLSDEWEEDDDGWEETDDDWEEDEEDFDDDEWE